ncbi:hypothetical protein EBBID32_8870 [Sphingobium indicum BiD32]|uniref:Uncharacterized protein n=1 Tax=Sphingobium indicum BiD32 TaxID=1301087 RepID=N1MHX1_9SPHN|nr:hypothetical protein EBBID32_8870 [Sphingobium indicum BiD32]
MPMQQGEFGAHFVVATQQEIVGRLVRVAAGKWAMQRAGAAVRECRGGHWFLQWR